MAHYAKKKLTFTHSYLFFSDSKKHGLDFINDMICPDGGVPEMALHRRRLLLFFFSLTTYKGCLQGLLDIVIP